MANLLFCNVPGHGHVNPSLPLTAELVRRGHAVTCLNSPGYRRAIEATGATFEPYAAIHDEYFDPWTTNGLQPMHVAAALLASTETMLPGLQASARALRADAILFDTMCPWGYYLARSLRLPAIASLSLMPSLPLSYLLRNREMLRAFLPALTRDFGAGIEAMRRSRALGARYGVRPLSPAEFLNATGDLSISYTSADFVPHAASVGPSVVFTGWTLLEAPAQDDAPLDVAEGRRLLYVSLGTLNSNAAAFFRACAAAFDGGDFDVLMTTGGRVDPADVGPLPSNVILRSWVAQTAVLRRAALFVTHGGMGGVHDALYLGLPMLLVPQQEEQTFTALRVQEIGAGIVVKKEAVTPQLLRTTAQRLLDEPRFAAASARMGEGLRAAGGPPRAADHVEALLGSNEGRNTQYAIGN